MTASSRRVLVAVDGSDFSLRAARRGLGLLASPHEPTVLMVIRPPAMVLPPAETAPMTPVVPEEAREDELARAHAEVAAARQSLAVEAEARIEWGEPGSTICDIAAAERFDVIVVGSHGTGWMKRLLVGSVSHHVVHHAPCPVLVVREPPTAGDEP